MPRSKLLSARLLPPLLLLVVALVLWALGFFGSAAPSGGDAVDQGSPRGAQGDASDTTEAVAPDSGDPAPDDDAPEVTRRFGESSVEASGAMLQVLDLEGDPVPQVEIGWLPLDEKTYYKAFDLIQPPLAQSLGLTDAMGRVSLPSFEGEGIGLVVHSDSWLGIAPTVLPLPPAEPAKLLVMPAGSVRGRVVDSEGHPVAGASLGALVTNNFLFGGDDAPEIRQLFGRPANHRYAKTDSDGSFRIGGLVETSNRLHILAPGKEPLAWEFQGPKPGEVLDLGAVVVEAGVEAHFEVRSPAPLAEGTLLYLEPEDNHTCRAIAGLALEPSGNLTIRGMRPGTYRWMVERPDTVAVIGELKVPVGGGRIAIDVAGQRTLTVEVVDQEGVPIQDFTLEAEVHRGRPRMLHGPGPVQVTCGAEQEIRVSAKASGYMPTRNLHIPATQSHATLEMVRFGSLTLNLAEGQEFPMLKVGLLREADEHGARILTMGVAPRSMRAHAVEDGRIHMERVPPGDYRVIVDHGGGPLAVGGVTVLPGENTAQEILLQELMTIAVVLRSHADDSAIPFAQVRMGGAEDARFYRSIADAFGGQEPADFVTDAEGRFSFRIQPGAMRMVYVEHADFEAGAFAVSAEADQPVRLRLQPSPTVPVRIMVVPGRPAKRGVLSFVHHPTGSALPTPLGEVFLDDKGEKTMQRIPSGTSLLHARFQWEPGVQYQVQFGEVTLSDDVPLELTLLPAPGYVAMGASPFAGESGYRIQPRESGQEPSATVRGLASAWGSLLPLPPGHYRVTATEEAETRYGSVEVQRGETSLVDWGMATRDLAINISGGDWHLAQVDVEVMDGPWKGVKKQVRIPAEENPYTLGGLPEGPLEVTFSLWVDAARKNHPVYLRKKLRPEASKVDFQFLEIRRVPVFLTTPDGHPLADALVESHLGATGEHGYYRTKTDREGKAFVQLALGPWMLQVFHPDHRLLRQRRNYGGEEDLRLQMPE